MAGCGVHRGFFWALFFALLGGCAPRWTVGDKERSFRPYEDAMIGREKASHFLTVRTAATIRGAEVTRVVTQPNGDVAVALQHPPGKPVKVALGSAVPIAPDGYYLTAAHCVHPGPCYVVIKTLQGLRVERARVVWEGWSNGEYDPYRDLAVLYVSGWSPTFLEWARDEELKKGTLLFAGGQNGPAAGPLLQVDSGERPGAQFRLVIHSAPLIPGDSGGPLILPDGRLVGINTIAELSGWSGPVASGAVRPDVQWLNQIIDYDRAAHAMARASRWHEARMKASITAAAN